MRRRLLFLIPITLLALAPAACGDDGGGGGDEPDASQGGGTLTFMEECDLQDDMCDTSMDLFCFGFNAKGPHCTRDCTMDQECEDPSPGCNNMGVCKAPDQ